MDKQIVVHVPFHRHEVPSAEFNMKDPAWWKRRAELFRDYTLASLLQQSDRDFQLVLSFAEEDFESGIVSPVLDTFEQYATGPDAFVWAMSEPYQECQWSVAPNHYAWFCEGFGGNGGPTWMIRLQIDSDDMFGPMVVERVRAEAPSEGLMLHWDAGWEYGLLDGKLAWLESPKGPPSFLAEYYPQAALQNAAAFGQYRERWQYNCYHHRTHKCPNNRPMQGGEFLQMIHADNSSLGWENPHTQRRIKRWITKPQERQAVLDIFGVEGKQ